MSMGARIFAGGAVLSSVAALFVLDLALGTRVAISSLAVLFGLLGWCELAALAGVGRRESGGGPTLFAVGFAGTAWFLALGWRPSGSAPGPAELAGAGIALLLLVAFASVVFRSEPAKGFQPLLVTVIGVLFCGYLFSFAIRIYQREDGAWLAAFFLVGVKGNDVAAYLVGTRFGRRRIFPVSPRKTLEGALAALAFGTLWFGGGSWIRPDLLFPFPAGLGVGLVLSAAAQLGDLSESLIKRTYRAKDSGALLPGLGGVLDVLDSFFYCGFLFWGALEALR